jgi:asparagine synthase (glutamine-hydrolysing)
LTALARALQERGAQALEQVGGDFALASWDERRHSGLLAIDRIGVHPLAYAQAGNGLAFASSLDTLCGHPQVRRSLAPQAVFDYLYYHVCPGPQTIYDGVMRLPAGHCLEFGPGGFGTPRPYWSLRFNEDQQPDLKALKQEFLGLLEASVKEASQDSETGSFLSGGTDSSTVSGMLGRVTGKPARSFSIGFDVPGYDETEYARIAARHFGCDHHEYYVKPTDVVEAVPLIAASYDQPFGNASAVPAFLCARYARSSGITRLLAGDGGDELFGGNERYAKQHLLGHYQRVPAALRSGLIEPLLMSMPFVGSVPPLRKLRSYVEQARPPMPRRYESYNLLQHLGAANVLTPDFLHSIDAHHPDRLLQATHAPHTNDSLINQMLAIDLRFVLTDGDLPKVMHTCNLADIDVAFPLLDDRIVEFSQRLPSDMKLRGTYLRWFFKQALLDFLPPEIITKKKHGFGLPVGQWLVGHGPLNELAAESVKRLVPRGIVRGEFVGDLLDRKLHEHPGYYGTMVWVLMMLSLWLDSRKL